MIVEEPRRLNPLWIAVPILTLGFGSFAPFLYAAVRRSSRALAAWTIGYVGAVAVVATMTKCECHPFGQ